MRQFPLCTFVYVYTYQVGHYHSHHQVGKDKRSNGDEDDEIDLSEYGVATAVQLGSDAHPTVLSDTNEQ